VTQPVFVAVCGLANVEHEATPLQPARNMIRAN
jgi:hypothetical protein